MRGIGSVLLRRAVLLLGASAVGVLALTGVASAESFTVTTPSDSNDGACTASLCSLRDAVVAADQAGTSSTITLPAGTYKLTIGSTGANDPTSGDLDVNDDATVTINGAGSGSTVVDANGIDRAFAVQSGAGLALSGMTIENGNPSSSSSGSQQGGAIYSDGALTITGDVVFNANAALNGFERGGAISTDVDPGSSLSVTGATFEGNNADDGGAIFLDQPGTASITKTVFRENDANDSDGGAIDGDNGEMNVDSSSFTDNNASDGGAIYWDTNMTVTVTNSSFTSNNATEGGALYDSFSSAMTLDSDRFVANAVGDEGGALYLQAAFSTATLDGDEFDDNSASYGGGAVMWWLGTLRSSGSSFIHNDGGRAGGALNAESGDPLALTNATISDNHAAQGGGVYYGSSTPTSLINDTIAFNSAVSTQGGGIYDPFDDATTGSGASGVLNTIVADNSGGDCGNGGGTSQFQSAVDAGFNLDGDSSCFQGDAASDKVGVDAKLAQPADNGGAVLTDRLLPQSPAIDGGTNSGCPPSDARGIPRPQGSSCDIGAFEAAAPNLSLSDSAPASGTTNIPFRYTINVTPSGPGPSTGTTVTDQLPAGETLYGATPSQGSCSSSGSALTCVLGTINASNNASVTVLVSEANPGSVTDTATATNDEGANVSASATTKLASPVAPAPGGSAPAPGGSAPAPSVSAPAAITRGHSHLTNHSAKLSGTVSTGRQTTWYFCQYGRSRHLGLASGLFKLSSSGNVAVTINHLLARKTYFFRLVAVNDSGISYGAKHSFQTKKKNNDNKKKHHA